MGAGDFVHDKIFCSRVFRVKIFFSSLTRDRFKMLESQIIFFVGNQSRQNLLLKKTPAPPPASKLNGCPLLMMYIILNSTDRRKGNGFCRVPLDYHHRGILFLVLPCHVNKKRILTPTGNTERSLNKARTQAMVRLTTGV